MTASDSVPVSEGAAAGPNVGVRVVLAVLVVLGLGAALLVGNPARDAETGAVSAAGVGHPALGSADAPVVILNFSDFQCGFCRRFALETEPALIEEYVEPGLVRMEWRDFPVLGEDSTRAALAGRAAHEQGRFWELHRVLYENQGAGFSDERLIALADEAGLDREAFADSLRAERHAGAVQADFVHGQQLGFSGTPTFEVNGRVLVGAQPIEVFRQVIDQALADAGATP